jgi:tetratricopeptide (TPR) repeat protein
MSVFFSHTTNTIKQSFFLILFIFPSFIGTAQTNNAVDKLVSEGIALHDKGEYAAAIAKYEVALILDKDNYIANFEKAFSCNYAKRYDDCIAISFYLMDKHKNNPDIKSVYSGCGSAYDDKGNADSAIIIYDKGLRLFPDFYLLHYNKALTLSRQKKEDEAMACFSAAMKIRPTHAGSLYYAAFAMEKSNKAAAIISGLCFLAVEPEGKRAKNMYAYIFELLNTYVVKDDKGNSTITLSMNDKARENNFTMVNTGLAIAMAAASIDTVKMKTDAGKLESCVTIMAETFSPGLKEGRGIYWKTYAPFFIEMGHKKLIETFAHIASITSGNEENIKWINGNQDKLKEFYLWMGKYEWKK